MELEPEDIPADYEVQPLRTREERDGAIAVATCGNCGLSWDDGKATSMTPTPSGRCPFEYFHVDDPRADIPWDEVHDDNPPHMTRNDNGSWYCHTCQKIIILFDDDKHYCEAADISGKPSPAFLCERFDNLVNGVDDYDGMSAGEVVQDILADVLDSVRLALTEHRKVHPEVVGDILSTVTDYVTNHYGDI